MKALVAIAMVLSLTVVAAAKLAPVSSLSQIEDHIQASVRDDIDINTGASGAMLERSYFQSPRRQFNVSCRLLNIFDKAPLPESCN
jgi:hypothetical protein